MAGGKDQSDANAMLREQQTRSNTGTDAFAKSNQADTDASRARGNDLYSSLSGGYKDLTQTQREQPITPTSGSSGGGGGGGATGVPGSNATFNEASNSYRDFMNNGGGVSAKSNAAIDDSEASYRNFIANGGWDPSRVASMDQNIQGLKGFGATGGLTADDTSRMGGGGVYDEFAKTGGYSAGDISNIRSRATSTIPQYYADMKNQANQMASIQGGYGPGQAAMMSRMSRSQAGAGADASLSAELGIKDKVNTGRLAGAAGMASTGKDIASLRTGNQLAGYTGASNVEQNMQDSINAGKEFGTTGLQSSGQKQRDAEMLAQNENAGFRLSGTQGIDSMAQNDRDAAFKAQSLAQSGAALGQQSAYQQQQQANWAAQFQESQKEYGLSGLQSLYSGAGPGELNTNKNFDLTNRGQGVSQGQAGAVDLKTGNKSWADYAAPIAGAVAGGLTGGASMLASGALGSLKPKAAPASPYFAY